MAIEREELHSTLFELWTCVARELGKNPFSIAARQGISVIYHEEDEPISGQAESYSDFRPDEMAIDIYNQALDRFWQAMFPGCAPELKYRYACWRELWHYWMHARFAPLHRILGDRWLDFVDRLSQLSGLAREYSGQYFASIATGVLKFEPC